MLVDAYRYKTWADQRTLQAVAELASGDPGAAALAFMCQQLNHMVIVEELFRARLLGEAVPHSATNTEVVPPFEALQQRLVASNAWAVGYLAGLDAEALAQPVTFRFADGQYGRLSRQEVLFHLVNHATYHRGAIGHALDLAGGKRPADTYTVFIHGAEPHRRQR